MTPVWIRIVAGWNDSRAIRTCSKDNHILVCVVDRRHGGERRGIWMAWTACFRRGIYGDSIIYDSRAVYKWIILILRLRGLSAYTTPTTSSGNNDCTATH